MGQLEIGIDVTTRPLRRPWLYYGWVNVVLAALAMTATFPGRTHGLAMINRPLQDALGIGDVFHGALNFWSVLLGAALCLPTGRLLDRFGTRAVLTTVAAALGVVVLLMSRVKGPTDLFLTMTLTRALGQGALSVVSMALIGKWFRRRLGPAMGLFSVLLAVGFIATTLGVAAGVQAAGWRTAWAAVGWALLLGVAPLSALLVRSTPEGSGGADPLEFTLPATGSQDQADATLADALRAPAFWVFTLAASLFNMIFSGFTFFAAVVLEGQGLDQHTFPLVMAALTFSGLVTNLLAGWLSTRWSLGQLLAVGLLLLAAALAVFPSVHDRPGALGFGLVLGASGGIITVVFFTMYGRLFGRTNLGLIQGSAQVLTVLASAAGPLLLAVCKGQTGSYALLFQATAAGSVLFALACWAVPPPRPALIPEVQGDAVGADLPAGPGPQRLENPEIREGKKNNP